MEERGETEELRPSQFPTELYSLPPPVRRLVPSPRWPPGRYRRRSEAWQAGDASPVPGPQRRSARRAPLVGIVDHLARHDGRRLHRRQVARAAGGWVRPHSGVRPAWRRLRTCPGPVLIPLSLPHPSRARQGRRRRPLRRAARRAVVAGTPLSALLGVVPGGHRSVPAVVGTARREAAGARELARVPGVELCRRQHRSGPLGVLH